MSRFIAKRLVSGVILIFAVSFLTFALIYSGGTDIARNLLGPEATAEVVASKAAELGLDRPFFVQYFDWLLSGLSGDLGKSWFSTETVAGAIKARFAVTFSLVAATMTLVTILSAVLGITAAVRGGIVDRTIQIVSVIGVALPNFWFALVLVRFLAIKYHIFPATGFIRPSDGISGWLHTIALPVVALTIGGVAAAAQQIRGAVADAMRQDYVRTLRAHGVPQRSILFKHALKNSSPAALTVLSLQFIGMFSGAVVIEKVFALPGLGLLGLNATIRGDIPMVMGVVMVMGIIVVLVNLLIDVANGWVNPKARIA